MRNARLSTRLEATKKNTVDLTQIDETKQYCCMHKVHEPLCDVNKKAYKPVLLAIGPYNNQRNVGKGFMEDHKLRYLRQMLERTKEGVETYIEALRKLEDGARKCYVECITQKPVEFVEMMLLDGCFIIELFRKYGIYKKTGDSRNQQENEIYQKYIFDDPIFKMKWVLPLIARDLLLFENQIPFFVVVELFRMVERNGSRNNGEVVVLDIEDQVIQTRVVSDLALGFFSKFLPFEWNVVASSYNSTERIKNLVSLAGKDITPSLLEMVSGRLRVGFRFKKAEFEHLLGLIHASISISILDTKIKHDSEFLKSGFQVNMDGSNNSTEANWRFILYDSDLQEAGVEFNKAKEFMDNIKKNGRWRKIPHYIELQEAGIELDKAETFKNEVFKKQCHDQIRNDDRWSKLCGCKRWESIPYGKELRLANVEFNKAKKFKSLRTIDHRNKYSAIELEEYGIKFEKAEKCDVFSITFNDGRMKISPLSIQDHTETCLRNLIAYEQYCNRKDGLNYVTNYVSFIDHLINSPKDIELLRQRGIIHNSLGDDEVTSNMVNKLCRYITTSTKSSIYARTYMDVNKHCSRRRNKWAAKLRRDYFNSPWAWISFLAAVLLLALTIVQTIFSIIP